MNPIFEKLLYLIVGGVAGSLVTIFVTKPKHEEQIDRLEEALEKYETQMDKEIEKARKAILEGFNNEGKNEKSSDEYDEDDNEKLEAISNRIVKNVKKAKTKPDMKKIIEENGYQEVDEDDEPTSNEVIEEDTNPYDDYEDIEIITDEEYGEYSDYDKEECYLTRDNVLVDDQGNMIEDVDSYVGYDSLNQLMNYDDEVIHVRNHQMKSDIAIYKDHNTYRNFKIN